MDGHGQYLYCLTGKTVLNIAKVLQKLSLSFLDTCRQKKRQRDEHTDKETDGHRQISEAGKQGRHGRQFYIEQVFTVVYCLCSNGFCRRDVVKIDARPTPSNLANTTRELPLHTDLPYYDYTPGVRPDQLNFFMLEFFNLRERPVDPKK